MNILDSLKGDHQEFFHNRGLIYDNILYIFAGEKMKDRVSSGEESLQIYVFSIIGKKMGIESSNNMFVDIKKVKDISVIVGSKNRSIEVPCAGIRIVR